ncbi:MAG TPA: mandelate racemase/muconate lactonizing enzyme family protein [Mycobacteriales bacterium]|nr:mandelate racemase/muconate lactonizing enzyme family protein [Mycobacteriales bacterium]
MAKISALESTVVAVPVDPPVWMSTRKLHTREYLLVTVRTEDGGEGIGYSYAGTSGGALLKAGVELLAHRVIGQDLSAIESIWAAMYQEGLLVGRRGALLRSISAIDIALWDGLAKSAGLPLPRLLGGWRESVPAYASGGYYRPDKDLDGLARELSSYAELGFTDFKIKVGAVELRDDVERVRTARATIGPHGRLALDANNAWKTPADAIRASRAFAEFDIWWLEEPLGPDDLPGHARIRAESAIPVATGEIEATRWGFRDMLGAADIIQADAGVAGGISEWIKIAHTAATFDVPVAPHWHANLHVPLAAATENCLTVEYFPLESGVYNFERLVAERLAPAAGRIPVSDRPGLGLVLDPAAVAEFRIA